MTERQKERLCGKRTNQKDKKEIATHSWRERERNKV